MLSSTFRAARLGRRRDQRGLSLVELLVGVAVGLFVVAATAMLAATQLTENRRMLLEAQVQQDLRATADIITRELRRAGSWQAADQGVWSPGLAQQPNTNLTIAPLSGSATEVSYQYNRPGLAQGITGFRLQGGTIESDSQSPGNWQQLTDSRTLLITGFTVTPRHVDGPELPPVQKLPCPKTCPLPGGPTDCWPTVQVREYQIDISGRAVSDAAVQRTVRTVARLRTEAPSASCPG